jgi:hypothetical protein
VASTRDGDGLPRQRKAVNPIRTTFWESHVFNSVRQGIPVLMILAPVRAGGSTLLSAVVLSAVLVIVFVVWAAIWSRDPERRKNALDVLDRLLRWKGGRLRVAAMRASVGRGSDIPSPCRCQAAPLRGARVGSYD